MDKKRVEMVFKLIAVVARAKVTSRRRAIRKLAAIRELAAKELRLLVR